MELSGKRVLVMGLGVHGGGLGVARWLLGQGAQVTITDLADPEALAAPMAALDEAAAALGATVAYTLGGHRAEDFTAAQMIVANPAVRPDSPWLVRAAAAGVPVETEMTLFFRVCRGPILGVTGTKGKTTTALMLAAMLRERHLDTVAAGNLRVSALEALEMIGEQTPVVLELSSFQLERLGGAGLSPRYSLVTNLSPDHLNWHGSMEAYAASKRQIYRHQGPDDVVALNGADDGSAEYCTLWEDGHPVGGRPIWVGAGPHWSRAHSRYPQPVVRAVDTRVELRRDSVLWSDARGIFGQPTPLQGEPLFARGDLRLPGAHNLYNAMLAAALARAYGIDAEAIRAAVRGFAGVEHRLELVRELDEVRYVNDTTATNPAAALAALAAIETPIVLIAGGADKQLDFRVLGAAIVRRAKALVLLEGSATPPLLEAISGCDVRLEDTALGTISGPYSDFAQAIAAARELAGPGETVLLSPGCASFGMFRNEFHRGEEFRRIVGELNQR
ncbi:MAG: UDP-N-acetylmuramoyl-L-alanine--D-glutamate ligase [Chloroflexales bacterium]|nr:UDP-N-acetylmuramoyl-L-alanine--D-glutamate ligase [Chloroflexales bacterium]